MALNATIFNFDIALSDTDHGVYETLALRVAKHPTETDDYSAPISTGACASTAP